MHYRNIALSASTLAIAIGSAGAAQAELSPLVAGYADIAKYAYEDSLEGARAMQVPIEKLLEEPSEENLEAAREAWVAARVPYMKTEVYRFGNAIVDDWEARVNAWPLDEGLIDYVDASYGNSSDENDFYAVNVIANPEITVAGVDIDATEIDADLLQNSLHEIGGNEANVATGYHAIEFLLWGQDLNGTDAGSGDRPYTDFDVDNCTGGNCDRRAQYLRAATSLLITDLEEMVANWQEDGAARQALDDAGEENAISMMLTGMGSLSYGELAGERMRLGLMLHDPEEEHDCFADKTHWSHYYDARGIRNVYLGQLERDNGEMFKAEDSLSAHVAGIDPKLDAEMKAELDASVDAMEVIVKRAEEDGEAYDQMIGAGNEEGNLVVQNAVDALVKQTHTIERIVSALGVKEITIEGSDSLDNPEAVFQ